MSKNPFDDDFKSSFGGSSYSKPLKSYTASSTIEDDVDYYEREIEKAMQESLDSTQRSRQQLENSEKIGAATAAELLEQREKLEKTERNLDEIHRTTQMTQRNLNSLKSVFGGFFKNKFSKKPAEAPSTDSIPQSKSAGRLNDTCEQIKSTSSYPTDMRGTTLSDSSRAAIKGTRWEAMDNEIDSNLDAMSANLRNLQKLGTALGNEVEEQNKMLDRIQTKAERNDAIVRSQDAQMQKILGSEIKKEEAAASSTPSLDTSTKMSLAMKATSLFR